MNGYLYRMKVETPYIGRGVLKERTLTVDVVLPDVEAFVPEMEVSSKYGKKIVTNNSGEFETRLVGLYVYLFEQEFRLKSSEYNGETQEKIKRLSIKALSSEAAMADIQRLFAENKVADDKQTFRYVVQLSIVNDGGWKWKLEYDNSSVTTEKGGFILEPEEIRESSGFHKVGLVGDEMYGLRLLMSRAEEMEIRASKKSMYDHKMKVISSDALSDSIDNEMNMEIFGSPAKSIVFLEKDFSMYYNANPQEFSEREFKAGFWQELRSEDEIGEDFRDEIISLMGIVMACPETKTVYLCCQHDPIADGRHGHVSKGCGRRDCSLEIVKSMVLSLLSMNYDKPGVNRDLYKQMYETAQVVAKNIKVLD